jgi:putative iron-dependent peroxidase
VAGFGSEVWPRLFSTPPPAELHPFRALAGDRHRAPATAGDMVLHIRAGRPDLCFELASQALTALGGAVTPVDEVQGFRFFDFRDLLGFVDGTENPTGQAAAEAALIGPDDPVFAAGSYLVVQRYQHDLAAWNALSVEEQQHAIGRDKLSNVEMPDEVTPPSAHRVLTSITDDSGRELAILRQHALRQPGRRRVRHVLHRVREDPGGAGADAEQHGHRGPARHVRPDPGLLDRGHRVPVLRAGGGVARGARRRRSLTGERPAGRVRVRRALPGRDLRHRPGNGRGPSVES